jgi:hypothetical protein
MGRIVDKLDELSLEQLFLLLRSGHSVSYEGAGAIRIFTPSMGRLDVALLWGGCKGGRFVVREMTKSA